MTDHARLDLLARLFEQIRHVPGNVVECGVFGGYTLGYLAGMVTREGNGRSVYGFDLWEPARAGELNLINGDSGAPPMMLWNDAMESIEASLLQNMADPKVFVLIPGWFKDTLPTTQTGQIAFLHIDADCYQSYKDVLENLWPRMSKGAIAVFDEYLSEAKWQGCKRAVDEYLGTQPHRLVKDIRAYAVKE